MTEDERHRVLEARVTALETHKAVETVHRTNVESRLSSIEDTLKWLVRLLGTAIIGALLTLVFNGGVPGG